jgi:hypothetical protein
MPEQHDSGGLEQRSILVEQPGRTVAGQDREIHVGRLAGWRALPVEEVRMPVDEPEAGAARQRLEHAEQERAVAVGRADAREPRTPRARARRSPWTPGALRRRRLPPFRGHAACRGCALRPLRHSARADARPVQPRAAPPARVPRHVLYPSSRLARRRPSSESLLSASKRLSDPQEVALAVAEPCARSPVPLLG